MPEGGWWVPESRGGTVRDTEGDLDITDYPEVEDLNSVLYCATAMP